MLRPDLYDFGLGTGDAGQGGWMLTLYSLITIYITSRVVAYMLDGPKDMETASG